MIGFPKVGKAVCLPKGGGNLLPQSLASRGGTVADDESDNLAGLAAKGNPNPAFVGFLENK